MANGVGPFGVDPYGNMPGGSLLHWTAETPGAPRSTAMDPSQLLGSSSLSTGDPALDALLQSQFKPTGPATGGGFSGSSFGLNSSDWDKVLKSPLNSSGPAAGSGFSGEILLCRADDKYPAGVGGGKSSGAHASSWRPAWRGLVRRDCPCRPRSSGAECIQWRCQ